MSIDLNTRLAKFEDLVPSTVPFVEGKLEGHRDRLNYSVIGPGVSEDAKQNVKIAEAHGFNIGGVNAAPMNGSGLHSHTTAEGLIRENWVPIDILHILKQIDIDVIEIIKLNNKIN